jgi:hypothetical protein
VFVTRGIGIRIPAGGLTLGIGPDGETQGNLRLQVALDMCPHWLEIAVAHLEVAAHARSDLISACSRAEESRIGPALEREFQAGMQAVTAAVIALDALYASVRERVAIPDSLVATWRRKRTARHRQVAEVLRRAFRVGPKSFARLAAALQKLYRSRDLAVHPPGTFSDPVLHPVLRSGTEWRFVSFGYESAYSAVRAALAFVAQLSALPRTKEDSFLQYCADLHARLEPLRLRWESGFGPLLRDPSSSGTD